MPPILLDLTQCKSNINKIKRSNLVIIEVLLYIYFFKDTARKKNLSIAIRFYIKG